MLFMLVCSMMMTSCMYSGSAIKTLPQVKTLKKTKERHAYIIGRVIFSDPFNKDGNILEGMKEKDYSYYRPAFTVCPSETRTDIFENKKCDFSTDDEKFHLNQYFALKIKPTDKLAWVEISNNHRVKPKILEKDSQKRKQIKKALDKYKGGFAWTNLRDFYVHISGPIEGGKVYYVGDIVIPMSDKSFLEYGDENYDKTIVLHTIPKDLKIKDDFDAAKKWASEKLKYEGEIQKPKLKLTPSKIESKVYEIFYQ